MSKSLITNKLKREANRLNAELSEWCGAIDFILPPGKHFANTGTCLVSGNEESILDDIAGGFEDCTEDCDHQYIDPDDCKLIEGIVLSTN